MGGYIGKGKSVVNVASYTKTQADATFLTPTGDGSQLTGISGSATDIVAFSTDPSVGSAGKIYYNTTTKVLRTSDGTAWTNVSNAAPVPTGGTVALTSTNEGAAFSYDLGANFTDDREGDTALTYALASGALPSGLAVPSSGSTALAGTLGQVAANTSYSFAITATDSAGLTSAPQSYTMTIIHVPFSASGGTITTSGGYKYHTFTSSGTLVGSGGSGSVEYLVVAGAGGGGNDGGGGGGAGGMLASTATVTAGNHTITVGGGGGGGQATGTNGSSGNNSAFGSFATSTGGGYGGGNNDNGGNGGSGGGAGQWPHQTKYGGSGTSGQGNSGGNTSGDVGGAGGGGKSAQGANGYGGNGAGGNGAQWPASSGTYYAGGGGGGWWNGSANGAGGLGGGASSGNYNGAPGQNGSANTGGGASAGSGGGDRNGGTGGSGIVIIRYLT